jgi:hypothetical protein
MEELEIKVPPTKNCHLDPDLRRISRNRDRNWKSIYGQSGGAETYLRNRQINEKDVLLLFFGSFKRTILNGEKLVFEKDHERHTIWGFLHVGKKYEIDGLSNFKKNNPELSWTFEHPHLKKDEKVNSIYIASNKFFGYPGAGVFKYDPRLVLTKSGYQKTIWEVPECCHPDFGTSISSHENKSIFEKSDGKVTFKSVDLGQEFIITGSKDVMKWAMNLINNCS